MAVALLLVFLQGCSNSETPTLAEDVKYLLQKQQESLMKVLQQQEEMKRSQELMEKRMDGIETQVKSIIQSNTSYSSSLGDQPSKASRVVTKSLTVSYFIVVFFSEL